ncbi:cytoplasmic protein [Coprinopsis cinerea okayama7|uniref:Cytoplasmic protein n=1 Tax=Coprinopsis cinerea (strain Okayama-7 / 130 / ATCC MYA-4618 / FGSC 9003) TaxID=240176 RepID=A8N6V5_COPC7|nr:cytoplasmic protein [Coprinopsis cinerea okayama7\|eukprot:XP_001830561.1 cytoplasmic protein [Coprinopsis cinerea okayama7\
MLDPEAVDDLLLACRYGDLEDVEAFVKQHGPTALGAVLDDNKNTVLHMVSANGHLELLKFLLPIVPPSLLAAQNNAGSTPLHWAALNNHLEVAKALVEFPGGPGVDLIDIKNEAGRSPLADAEFSGWDEGAKWLVEVMKLDPEAKGQETDDTVVDAQDIEVEIEDASGQVAKINISKDGANSTDSSKPATSS